MTCLPVRHEDPGPAGGERKVAIVAAAKVPSAFTAAPAPGRYPL